MRNAARNVQKYRVEPSCERDESAKGVEGASDVNFHALPPVICVCVEDGGRRGEEACAVDDDVDFTERGAEFFKGGSEGHDGENVGYDVLDFCAW